MPFFDRTNVIELSEENFNGNRIVSPNMNNRFGLILFYAEWCPHCVSVKSPYINFANEMKRTSKGDVVVFAVNTEKQPGITKRFGVKGFPTIKFIENGRVGKDFSGSRDLNGFREFMCKNISTQMGFCV